MIVYHPVHDLYHCVYRMTNLLQYLPSKEFSSTRLKIYDYYLLFPHEVKKVTLPRHLLNLKKIVNNKYYYPEINKSIFFELNGLQDEALRIISIYGITNAKLYHEKSILKKLDNKDSLFNSKELNNKVLLLFSEYFEKLNDNDLIKKTNL